MSRDEIKSMHELPQPRKPKEASPAYTGPVKRPDGREARKTDRQKQFNPRVNERFLERFADAKAAEQARTGENLTQAYFLDLLLSMHERAHGGELRPFGLSEPAFEAAQAIADHMGWSLSVVIEDAIAARYKQFNFASKPGVHNR